MLTEDEIEQAYNHFNSRLKWYRENVPNVDDRVKHLCAEYGLPPEHMENVIRNLVDEYIGMPMEILLLIAPTQVMVVSAALYVGIEIGHKMNRVIADDSEEEPDRTGMFPDGFCKCGAQLSSEEEIENGKCDDCSAAMSRCIRCHELKADPDDFYDGLVCKVCAEEEEAFSEDEEEVDEL